MIHAHFGPTALELLKPARDLGIPLLVTFHGRDASGLLRHPGYVRSVQRLLEYAWGVAVSEAIVSRLRATGARDDRMRVLYVGVPLEHFPFRKRESLRSKVAMGEKIEFLQVSRLVEKKGTPYTLQAFRRFLGAYPNARLTIAGDGPLRAEISLLASEMGLSDKVMMPGKVSAADAAQLMLRSDVLLQHSVTASDGDEEGLPTVLVEAMATGLPVVSTYHSGIPELVKDGVNGFLVQERDVDAYEARLRDLMKIDESIGCRAYETVRANFNIAVQNDRLAAYYGEILRAAVDDSGSRPAGTKVVATARR
jgi:glycosyltransferase involved in cell wall biosynthesis